MVLQIKLSLNKIWVHSVEAPMCENILTGTGESRDFLDQQSSYAAAWQKPILMLDTPFTDSLATFVPQFCNENKNLNYSRPKKCITCSVETRHIMK